MSEPVVASDFIDNKAKIEEVFEFLSMKCFRNSESKGFWKEGINRNKAEMIALMHSELSECLEGIRKGNPADSHCQNHGSVEIELADTLIRIFDFAGGFNINLGEALIAKMIFNLQREKLHGKKF